MLFCIYDNSQFNPKWGKSTSNRDEMYNFCGGNLISAYKLYLQPRKEGSDSYISQEDICSQRTAQAGCEEILLT